MKQLYRKTFSKLCFTSFYLAILSLPAVVFADALLDIDGSKRKIVNPSISQTEFSKASIDNENFELIAYTGFYSFENFDTRAMIGAKGSFHFNNRLFIDLDYAGSSVKGDAIINNNAISVDEGLSRYDAGLVINLFDGRMYLNDGFALSNEFYLKYAQGKIEINNAKNDFSSIGMGIRLLHPNDFFVVQLGFSKDSVESGSGLDSSENTRFFAGAGIYF